MKTASKASITPSTNGTNGNGQAADRFSPLAWPLAMRRGASQYLDALAKLDALQRERDAAKDRLQALEDQLASDQQTRALILARARARIEGRSVDPLPQVGSQLVTVTPEGTQDRPPEAKLPSRADIEAAVQKQAALVEELTEACRMQAETVEAEHRELPRRAKHAIDLDLRVNRGLVIASLRDLTLYLAQEREFVAMVQEAAPGIAAHDPLFADLGVCPNNGLRAIV